MKNIQTLNPETGGQPPCRSYSGGGAAVHHRPEHKKNPKKTFKITQIKPKTLFLTLLTQIQTPKYEIKQKSKKSQQTKKKT
jgi:hypothetical protein